MTAIAVMGTMDTKAEEHLFLKERIESRGFDTIIINLGTGSAVPFGMDLDLMPGESRGRDRALAETLVRGREAIADLYARGGLRGIISAGGGTGTYLASSIMKVLPLGVPKVMVSTVAARDLTDIVGVSDLVMFHSVGDLLGVNSVTGVILDQAAAAVCGMASSDWKPAEKRRRVALTMFGFITKAAEAAKRELEARGLEVVAFHANGTGGPAMESLAEKGLFDAILDLATHELADTIAGGYCRLRLPGRLEFPKGMETPRLVVPGGMDCAVLEFDRTNVPPPYRDKPVFFYDFRSAVRLGGKETMQLADELGCRLKRARGPLRVLAPLGGLSAADAPGAPLRDSELTRGFTERLEKNLKGEVDVETIEAHINDPGFATRAVQILCEMLETG